MILKTKKDKPAGLHGGMKAGNLILSVENKSLENIFGYKDHQSIMDDFKHEPYVTFQLNIAMSEDILVIEDKSGVEVRKIGRDYYPTINPHIPLCTRY